MACMCAEQEYFLSAASLQPRRPVIFLRMICIQKSNVKENKVGESRFKAVSHCFICKPHVSAAFHSQLL